MPSPLRKQRIALAWSLVAVWAVAGGSGCGGPGNPNTYTGAGARFVRLDLGGRATPELVGYYAAGFLKPPSDAFRAGLIRDIDGRFYLNLDTLAAVDSLSASRLAAIAPKDVINWDDFASFLEETHSVVRRQPGTLGEFYDDVGFDGQSEAWLTVEVTGVMTTLRRRVAVEKSRLVEALLSMSKDAGRGIVYPVGTAFVAEHLDADSVREVTAMLKREDGQWDFFLYGRDGLPLDSTAQRPRSLRVPTQCVGCHFGSKLYEPEKSFPAGAPDGPHGPRKMHVGEELRDVDVVRYFDEHRKRTDHVLGLYATVFVAQLRQERAAGKLESTLVDLLEALEL